MKEKTVLVYHVSHVQSEAPLLLGIMREVADNTAQQVFDSLTNFSFKLLDQRTEQQLSVGKKIVALLAKLGYGAFKHDQIREIRMEIALDRISVFFAHYNEMSPLFYYELRLCPIIGTH